MSYGCGTLAAPGAFNLGIAAASRSNGKQNGLPENPRHERIPKEAIEELHGVNESKEPSRLWGQVKATKLGGIERVDSVGTLWTCGDYWNVDSNISKWGAHEVRRNGACASHDVHRHDQITRLVLPPKPGDPKPPRNCVSGVVSPDCCFLEAWGFDLGLRDRQGRNTTLWRPAGRSEMFRSERSFDRNTERILANYKSLRRTATLPGTLMAQTLKPEDVGGEAGELSVPDDATMLRAGRTFGSRSCYGWDRYDHTCYREAAKMSCAVHCPAEKEHAEGYPFKELDLNPAAVYTKKFRLSGETSLRSHLGKSTRVPAGLGQMR
ncbi:unnamed protein product [Effrenium voratum]|uniref:Uncharacterized protein n=1 Tax=Effrenium voratum TaxID=2562239 RepID=A0AA36MST9_9DINO|nr:unnamed protein product [Effrenium voratum]CAJ1424845.1 unnamed protein product [Effrenium voratum]